MKTYLALLGLLVTACRTQTITMPVSDKHLLKYDSNEVIDLQTLEDAKFTMPVFFGDPQQGRMMGEFIPFTMSSLLSVTTTNCTSCGTQYYDPSKSKEASFDVKPENFKNRTIGPHHYEEGYIGTDKVCFPRSDDVDICADDVEIFAVT